MFKNSFARSKRIRPALYSGLWLRGSKKAILTTAVPAYVIDNCRVDRVLTVYKFILIVLAYDSELSVGYIAKDPNRHRATSTSSRKHVGTRRGKNSLDRPSKLPKKAVRCTANARSRGYHESTPGCRSPPPNAVNADPTMHRSCKHYCTGQVVSASTPTACQKPLKPIITPAPTAAAPPTHGFAVTAGVAAPVDMGPPLTVMPP